VSVTAVEVEEIVTKAVNAATTVICNEFMKLVNDLEHKPIRTRTRLARSGDKD